jgi:integrase
MTKGYFHSLPLEQWPVSDRQAWLEALKPGDPFEPGGVASDWAEASCRKTRLGYGHWLDWLQEHGFLDPDAAPAARVTHERVRAYTSDLQQFVSAFTVQGRLQELADGLRALAPERDWRWLLRASSRLRQRAHSVRNKQARIQSSDVLAALGERLMEQAEAKLQADAHGSRNSLIHSSDYRDGLMIGLLAYRPIRSRNLSEIVVGKHLVRRGDTWWLLFEETKTHQPLECPVPDRIYPYLDRYLRTYRPILLTRGGRQLPATQALWVSVRGTALDKTSIGARIERLTREEYGVPLSPHLFRDSAATSIAIADPERVRIIKEILGHSTFDTADKHYNQASQLQAGRRYNDTIDSLCSARRQASKPRRKRI